MQFQIIRTANQVKAAIVAQHARVDDVRLDESEILIEATLSETIKKGSIAWALRVNPDAKTVWLYLDRLAGGLPSHPVSRSGIGVASCCRAVRYCGTPSKHALITSPL